MGHRVAAVHSVQASLFTIFTLASKSLRSENVALLSFARTSGGLNAACSCLSNELALQTPFELCVCAQLPVVPSARLSRLIRPQLSYAVTHIYKIVA